MTVINNLKNALIIQIEKPPGLSTELLGLCIHCRGEVVLFQSIDLSSSLSQIKIPREQ